MSRLFYKFISLWEAGPLELDLESRNGVQVLASLHPCCVTLEKTLAVTGSPHLLKQGRWNKIIIIRQMVPKAWVIGKSLNHCSNPEVSGASIRQGGEGHFDKSKVRPQVHQ